MNKAVSLFLMILFLSAPGVYCQSGTKADWSTSTELTSIPDSLKGKDAVMIAYDRTISNFVDPVWGRVISGEMIYERIKFLNKKGTDIFSKIYLTRTQDQVFDILKARTIKRGGKIIEVPESDFKKSDFSNKTDGVGNFIQEYKFSLPGVEIGDEAEITYRLLSTKLNYGTDVFLQTYLPCLEFNFTYVSGNNIKTEISDAGVNSKPIIGYLDHATTHSWKVKGAPELSLEENSIPSLSIPFVSIVVRSATVNKRSPRGGIYDHEVSITPPSWSEFYEQNERSFAVTDSSAEEDTLLLRNFFREKTGNVPTDSVFNCFLKLYRFIADSITIAQPFELLENKPLLYYLENHKIDHYHLLTLYRSIFNFLGMNYYSCFGRNKYYGALNPDHVASYCVTEFFFGVKDPEGKIRFVYPGYSGKIYYLDELPTFLEGTNVILVSNVSQGFVNEKNVREVRTIKIPPGDINNNFHNERMKINVRFEKGTDIYELRDKFSGALSIEYRETLISLFHEKNFDEVLNYLFGDSELDSAMIVENADHFPYPIQVNYYFKSPSLYNEIDSSIYSLSINKLIHFSIVYSNQKPRTFDFFSDQKYKHRCDFELTFDHDVRLLNAEGLSRKTENEFGSFETRVSQIRPNTLMFQVIYSVYSFRLPKKSYPDIRELELSFERFRNKEIVVKKL